ncbi:MAG: amylo-alpha-1,6-glucosidase [Pseudomonadota bacterium]
MKLPVVSVFSIVEKFFQLPDFIRFGRAVCGDLQQAEQREWWLANGLGGYAAGTVAGTLTRRYHGLLVAPLPAAQARYLLCAKADAWLVDGEQRIPLCSNRWGGGVIAPRGYINLESFHLEGRVPVWRYAWGDILIEQRIWMEQGAHTTYVMWRLLTPTLRALKLHVNLLANARDHHHTCLPGSFNPKIDAQGTRLRVHQAGVFDLHIQTQGGTLSPRHDWMDNFDLPQERIRGLDDRDAHLCVGEVELALYPDEGVGLVVSLDFDASPYLSEALRRHQAHDLALLRAAEVSAPAYTDAPPWVRQLVLAADSFLFSRPLGGVAGESVIAGYPWFGEWGRDTLIALPGLTLASGRLDAARRILETFSDSVRDGLLPNFVQDSGEAVYTSADAALWYIDAWRAYYTASADKPALKRAYPGLAAIIAAHVAGTRLGIAHDPVDGLLRAGAAGLQVTWMDAKVGDQVVTPRVGKPVEINALWYNALCVIAEFARQLKRDAAPYQALAALAKQGFARFIKADGGGLFDVLDGDEGDDVRLRPNQIFAVSLTHSPLDSAQQARVVETVGQHLLTSYGLRSLDPAHPDYRPHYHGDMQQRDTAYHQGTAWAWLLPHFVWAEFRVGGDLALANLRLNAIGDHLLDAGLGSVSEVFDGAAPHAAGGTPAQAWSVACALEAWWRLQLAQHAGSAA